MSVRTIKFRSAIEKYVLGAVALGAAIVGLYQARLDLASSAAYQGLDPRAAESRPLAEWLINAAPNDPYVRLAAAHYFEKTFEPNDLERGLAEYEAAAALSPHHYAIWLQLGASRDRNGDSAGAERAYERALELAPSYAPVAWQYGNSLVRHGNGARGFTFIAKAASSDPEHYADAAVSTALQFFGGDADEVRRALGSSSGINAAMASVLASQKKWDLAYDAWTRIPQEDKQNYKDVGNRIVTLSNDAHYTRVAAYIARDLSGGGGVGSIANGGFEDGLKLRNAQLFEWQIGDGTEPQIGLSESVKRSGRYSLSILFNSFEAAEFRPIWQRIAVEPGAIYEFEGFYRAEIKSKAAFKWEIVDLKQNVLASSDPLALNGDWAVLRARFTVPADLDGIVLRFVRTGCGATGACPVTGKAYFDDFSLQRVQ